MLTPSALSIYTQCDLCSQVLPAAESPWHDSEGPPRARFTMSRTVPGASISVERGTRPSFLDRYLFIRWLYRRL